MVANSYSGSAAGCSGVRSEIWRSIYSGQTDGPFVQN